VILTEAEQLALGVEIETLDVSEPLESAQLKATKYKAKWNAKIEDQGRKAPEKSKLSTKEEAVELPKPLKNGRVTKPILE